MVSPVLNSFTFFDGSALAKKPGVWEPLRRRDLISPSVKRANGRGDPFAEKFPDGLQVVDFPPFEPLLPLLPFASGVRLFNIEQTWLDALDNLRA